MSSSYVRHVVNNALEQIGMAACSDVSCCFGPPGGHGSNSGCRCFVVDEISAAKYRVDMRRLATVVRILAQMVSDLDHELPSR